MSWILWSLAAALCWATANIVDKHVVEKRVKQEIVPVMVLGLVGLLGGLIVFAVKGFTPLPFAPLLWALVSGALYALMIFFYFKAAKQEEISRVVPLLYTAPLWVAIFAAFIVQESLTGTQYIGVASIILGALLISYKGTIKPSKAFWYCMAAAISIAMSEVLTKYLLGFADYWTVFGYSRVGSFLALAPLFFIYWKPFATAAKEKTPLALMSFSEGITVMGLLFLTIAFSTGKATLVSALSSLQPFFVLLLSILISLLLPRVFKEEITRKIVGTKILAIVLVFLGIMLLT